MSLYEAVLMATATAALFGAAHHVAWRGWPGCAGVFALYVLLGAVARPLKHHVDPALFFLLVPFLLAAIAAGAAAGGRRRKREGAASLARRRP